MSIIFDFMMLTLNTTYSIRVLMSYFEFLSIITFYFVFSMIVKLKVFLIVFYNQMEDQGLSYT